jgi:hypothetical protein
METIRADLATADPRELTEHLALAGIPATLYLADDGLHILTDVDPTAALASFVPVAVSDPEERLPSLPEYVRTHIAHLRDYRQAVRDGQTPTAAQTAHALADVIDALRLLNGRITGDD